jgi:hypothetical protein
MVHIYKQWSIIQFQRRMKLSEGKWMELEIIILNKPSLQRQIITYFLMYGV